MAQHHVTPSTHLLFIVILFFLSYVLSSAPKYLRGLKENKADTAVMRSFPTDQLMKIGMIYGAGPYIRAWKSFRPSIEARTMLDYSFVQ